MSDATTTKALVEQAIACCGGSQSDLARAIGGRCRQGHVYKWLRQPRVSGEVALQIEIATKGAVTRAELRPDLFADQARAA